jgi:small GTP-binding protein
VGHKSYCVWFHDTAGKKDYDALRPLSYPGANVFLVCYDIASPSSFRNVYAKWVPEIRRHCPTTPFLLVATKIDLRGDESVEEKHGQQGLGVISTSEGKAMAVHLGAAKYIECSAKTQYQLQHLLQEVSHHSFFAPRRRERLFPLSLLPETVCNETLLLSGIPRS